MVNTDSLTVYNTGSGVALGTFVIACTSVSGSICIPVVVPAGQLHHLPIDKAVLCPLIGSGRSVCWACIFMWFLIVPVVVRPEPAAFILSGQRNILSVNKAKLVAVR